MPTSAEPSEIVVDPFLLPVCRCGGPCNLAAVEPDLICLEAEHRLYRCMACGDLRDYLVRKRRRH